LDEIVVAGPSHVRGVGHPERPQDDSLAPQDWKMICHTGHGQNPAGSST
jgi:hypothetical protein